MTLTEPGPVAPAALDLAWGLASRRIAVLRSEKVTWAASKPLALQGGRDYQVTVAGDLTGRQATLAGRQDVTIRAYEAADHLPCPGSGPSPAAAYELAQQLAPAVVTDIAHWLTIIRAAP